MIERLTSLEYQLDEEKLLQPIPDMATARVRKIGYNDVPINTDDPRHYEPLVSLIDYGIAGQSYYSKPNVTTKDPIPGVDPNTYLRKSLAEDVKKIDMVVRSDAVTAFFGRPVCLYVQDSLRSVTLQQKLYEEYIPKIIQAEHPEANQDKVEELRSHVIAKPSLDPSRPSPHATGAAFDLELRYQNPDGTASDEAVEVGLTNGASDANALPDYYETHQPTTEKEIAIQRNRRAFYNLMTGSAFGAETGFVNNPTEWWHWGRGDQLSARISNSEPAAYSLPLDFA